MQLKFNPKDISIRNMEEIKEEVINLKSKGINPCMDVILVGNNDSARVYAETKMKIGKILGIDVIINEFSENSNETDIIDLIQNINFDSSKHGIMIESPVPQNMDYDNLLSNISPLKDIDGLHPSNLGYILANSKKGILPATPIACISILDELVEKIEGLNITIVGHGRTVGGPLSTLLSNMGATINTCTVSTKDLKKECINADVIITATGVAGLIKEGMVTDNTIVIDAGISVNSEGNLTGDTDYNNVSKIAKYVSPVPGGVGVVTTSLIFKNLIRGIKLQEQNNDIFDASLNDFIKISKGSGMPGGGGISAISAINSISMISMVYSLTKDIDKLEYEPKVDFLIKKLKLYYNMDIESFNKYLNSIKLPKTNDSELEYRSSMIQSSLIDSSEIPIKIAEVCLEILDLSRECYKVGNKNVLTDVLVGINLAIASGKSALEPLEMNLKSVKDEKIVESILNKKNYILDKLNNFSL